MGNTKRARASAGGVPKSQYQIFFASPSELTEERQSFSTILERVNQQLSREALSAEPWRWETHGTPGLGDVQDLINRHLDESHVVVVGFWKRVGTKTDRGESGTVEELQHALEAYSEARVPRVLIYFREQAPTYAELRDPRVRAENDELNRLRAWLESEKHWFVKGYADQDAFRSEVELHVCTAIRQLHARTQSGVVRPASRARPSTRASFDRASYAEHIDQVCGSVSLSGLLAGKSAAPVPIERIHIPLYVGRNDALNRGETAAVGAAVKSLLTTLEQTAKGSAEGQAAQVTPPKLSSAARRFLEHAGLPRAEALRPATITQFLERVRASDSPLAAKALLDLAHSTDAQDALRIMPRLVIRGLPGSGKTTTLHFLASQLIKSDRPDVAERLTALGWPSAPPVPCFFPLRTFNRWLAKQEDLQPGYVARQDGDVLREFVLDIEGQHASFRAWMDAALDSDRLQLLIDGIDEVPSPQRRARVVSILAAFARDARHARVRIACTSRPEGLSKDVEHQLQSAGFALTDIAPLALHQVEQFLERWYAVLESDPAKARARVASLVEQIRRRGHVAELADSPIALVMMAAIDQRGRLPETRAKLYEHCIEAFCENWDNHKGEEGREICGEIGLDGKRSFFESLALRVHSQGRDDRTFDKGMMIDIAQQEFGGALQSDLGQARCEQLIQHTIDRSGLVLPRGEVMHEFRHLAFQEFLAARKLASKEDRPADALRAHLADPHWRQVVAFAPAFKAITSPADARRLLSELGQVALDLCGCGSLSKDAQVSMLAALALAATDLRLYHDIGSLDPIVGAWKPSIQRLVDDLAQPGAVADRIRIARLLGLFGPDPRLADEQRWIHVPAGTFWMGGNDKDSHGDEQPIRQRTIQAFELQRWPVTVGEYATFVADGRKSVRVLELLAHAEGAEPGDWATQMASPSNHPIHSVSWWQASAYCAWLTERERTTDANCVCRLPSEAEWEWAARGSEVDAHGRPRRTWPWGSSWEAGRANTLELSLETREPTPVGCFPAGAGPYGAWDQAGNVWEWCEDTWHDNYKDAPTDGIAWVDKAPESRLLRGGSFVSTARYARSAYRFRYPAGSRWDYVGFRPARPSPLSDLTTLPLHPF